MGKSVGYEPYGIPTHVCRGQLRCILLSNQDSSLVVLAFVILLLMFGISKSIRRSSVGEFQVSNYPLVVCQECKQKKRCLDAQTINTFVLRFSFPNRECPPEFREAVSTLIFAAARYPDLPELCDLRHIFTERYGNFVEHFVSREVRKMMLIYCY